MGLCQAVFNQLGSKQMLLRRAGMVVLELGMESGSMWSNHHGSQQSNGGTSLGWSCRDLVG